MQQRKNAVVIAPVAGSGLTRRHAPTISPAAWFRVRRGKVDFMKYDGRAVSPKRDTQRTVMDDHLEAQPGLQTQTGLWAGYRPLASSRLKIRLRVTRPRNRPCRRIGAI